MIEKPDDKKQESPIEALDLLRDNALALAGELSGGASKAIEAETHAAYAVVKAVLDQVALIEKGAREKVPILLGPDVVGGADVIVSMRPSKKAKKHAIERVEEIGTPVQFQAYCVCGSRTYPYPNRQWAVAALGTTSPGARNEASERVAYVALLLYAARTRSTSGEN